MLQIDRESNSSILIQDRIYGEVNITDPLAIAIIQTKTFQRLDDVSQMGVYNRAFTYLNTTRAEHSVGVYYLLNRFGAEREEQIAGLLHDVSHTVFSHVIDHMLQRGLTQDFQDKKHGEFIRDSEIPTILQKHGLGSSIVSDLTSFTLLDRHLPNLCADRLDYGLRDGVICEVIPVEHVEMLLQGLEIAAEHWVFTEPTMAEYYFEKSIQMARDWWAPCWGVLQFQLMGRALRLGLDTGIIMEADLFTTENEVWEKLESSNDPKILEDLDRVKGIADVRYEIVANKTDLPLQSKYRGTNPLIFYNDLVVPVSFFCKNLTSIFISDKREIESLRYARLL